MGRPRARAPGWGCVREHPWARGHPRASSARARPGAASHAPLPPDSSKKVQDVLRDFYGDGALSQHLQGEVGPRGGPGAARCPPPALPQPLCAPPSQCVDFEGFRLFLQSYLEATDVPEALCRHLFMSFQSTAPGQPGEGWGGDGDGGQEGPPGGPTGLSAAQHRLSRQAAASSALTTSPATSRCWRAGAPRTSWSVSGGACGGRAGGAAPISPPCALSPPPPVTFKLYDKDGNGLLDSSVSDGGSGGGTGRVPPGPLPDARRRRRWSGSSPR